MTPEAPRVTCHHSHSRKPQDLELSPQTKPPSLKNQTPCCVTSSKRLSLSEPQVPPRQACPRNGSLDLTPALTPPTLSCARSTEHSAQILLAPSGRSCPRKYFLCRLWRPAPGPCGPSTDTERRRRTLCARPTGSSEPPCTVVGPRHCLATALPTRETRARSARGLPLPRASRLSRPHRLSPRRREGAAGLPCPRSRRG